MPVILWIVIVLVTSVFLLRWLNLWKSRKKQEKGVPPTAGTAPAAVGNNAYQAQPVQAKAASVLSTEERLSLCKDLLSAGAITPEEYESRKQQILVQESR